MNPAFNSARSLLAWAREDTLDFEAKTLVFLEEQPYSVFREVDPESGNIELKMRMDPIPQILSKLASHAVWDLKHAMDHATWAAVSVVTGTTPGDLHFPISGSRKWFENRLGPPKGKSEPRFPLVLHDVFRRFEPYPAEDGYAGSDELCAFSKMANSTKHAVALGAHARSQIVGYRGTGGLKHMYVDKWDSLKNELSICQIIPGAEFNMNFEFTSDIAFSDVELFKNYPAGTVLRQVANAVEEIIDTLEAEATRFAAS